MRHHGGIEIICFASLYALAFVLELTRLFWRETVVRPITLLVVGVGLAVQTWFIVSWIGQTSLLRSLSLYDSLLVLSWMLVVIDAYLSLHYPTGPGLLFFPIVLGALGVAKYLEGRDPVRWTRLGGSEQFWGMVHGLFLIAGAVAATVGFAAGVTYLVQARRLKAKLLPAPGLPLPSLERLERANKAAITLAFPLLTFGLAIGIVLTAALRRSRSAGPTVSWLDSKVISTALFWLVFAVLLHVRSRADLRGRKVALLTIVAFGFLIFALLGPNLLTRTWHAALGGGPT